MTDAVADDNNAATETPLTDETELLYRQIPPVWVDDGIPSSQAFVPTKKDSGKLSIYLGSQISPEDAYKHYTTVEGLKSEGSWGISVGELQQADLNSFPESLGNNQAHGFIDFRGLGRKQCERKGKLLVARARDRGRLHP
jgi:hypothetical protein